MSDKVCKKFGVRIAAPSDAVAHVHLAFSVYTPHDRVGRYPVCTNYHISRPSKSNTEHVQSTRASTRPDHSYSDHAAQYGPISGPPVEYPLWWLSWWVARLPRTSDLDVRRPCGRDGWLRPGWRSGTTSRSFSSPGAELVQVGVNEVDASWPTRRSCAVVAFVWGKRGYTIEPRTKQTTERFLLPFSARVWDENNPSFRRKMCQEVNELSMSLPTINWVLAELLMRTSICLFNVTRSRAYSSESGKPALTVANAQKAFRLRTQATPAVPRTGIGASFSVAMTTHRRKHFTPG